MGLQPGIDGRRQVAALLFEAGSRPDAAAIAALAGNSRFSISADSGAGDGWVELLREGLTFDLSGLQPGPMAPRPVVAHRYGLAQDFAETGYEALTLGPGPHLSGAENMLPVVKVASSLLMELARLPGVKAISWLPAANLVSPEWFARAVAPWRNGGPFPAFALASIARRDGTGVSSLGLAFYTGQEFRLEIEPGRPMPATDVAIAIRLLDWLVGHGPLTSACEVSLADVGTVELEPGPKGEILARCR